MMLVFCPELIDRNRAESVPALVVCARRSSSSAELEQDSTSSAILYHQTTSLTAHLPFHFFQQVGKCTLLASVH